MMFVEEVEQITFSGKSARDRHQAVLAVTERCVFSLIPDGWELIEAAPRIDIERDILAHMKFGPIIRKPHAMAAVIFTEGPMGLGIRRLVILSFEEKPAMSTSQTPDIQTLNHQINEMLAKFNMPGVDPAALVEEQAISKQQLELFRAASSLLLMMFADAALAPTDRRTGGTALRDGAERLARDRQHGGQGQRDHLHHRPASWRDNDNERQQAGGRRLPSSETMGRARVPPRLTNFRNRFLLGV
jgi:hypothetical protein